MPLVLVAGLVAVACGRSEPSPTVRFNGSSSSWPTVLPHRTEVVAQAHELAVSGTRRGGKQGAALLLEAAELRTRIWRLERREADALEALELYRAAAEGARSGTCQAQMRKALLEAELRQDLVETYRAFYSLRAKASADECRHRADQVLLALSAFKPLPAVLAELDREALASNAGAKAGVAVATVKTSGAPEGAVVVPDVKHTRREPARITSIERYGAQDAARIVVFVTHPSVFSTGFLEASANRGPRLYVDIDNATYQGVQTFDVGGIVERVRLGQQKKATRLVLDLTEPVYRKIFYLPEPFRLVIDVSKQPPPSVAQVNNGPRRIGRIVLDPGHGGHDPGAIGPNGLREKDVTLDIAKRAAQIIAWELGGIHTRLTRRDDADEYVPLDARTHIANQFQADLFVSIHCNASENVTSHGVMTFILDESRDALASSIAARENAASPAAAAELANVMSRVVDPATMAASSHFAELLQKSSVGSLRPAYADVIDKGIRRAGFYVLAGARMPAVLYETSFISNPLGEMRLNTSDYRQKIADAIVNAIRAYRDGR
jgi:N-acetylmuramoyl-L-alanine amidase